jgi:hypothetical protein
VPANVDGHRPQVVQPARGRRLSSRAQACSMPHAAAARFPFCACVLCTRCVQCTLPGRLQVLAAPPSRAATKSPPSWAATNLRHSPVQPRVDGE